MISNWGKIAKTIMLFSVIGLIIVALCTWSTHYTSEDSKELRRAKIRLTDARARFTNARAAVEELTCEEHWRKRASSKKKKR